MTGLKNLDYPSDRLKPFGQRCGKRIMDAFFLIMTEQLCPSHIRYGNRSSITLLSAIVGSKKKSGVINVSPRIT